MKEYKYFKVLGGQVKSAIELFNVHRAEQQAARVALMKEFGSEMMLANSHHIVALKIDDVQKIPDGWKQHPQHKGFFKPHGSSKEMMAIRSRMNGLKLSGWMEFQAIVLGKNNPFEFADSNNIRFMLFEKVGEEFILLVPKCSGGDSKGYWNPPDDFCVPLKTSEYWQIKEQNEPVPQDSKQEVPV